MDSLQKLVKLSKLRTRQDNILRTPSNALVLFTFANDIRDTLAQELDSLIKAKLDKVIKVAEVLYT